MPVIDGKPAGPPRPGPRHLIAVGAALSAGFGLAVQSRLNGELGARLGDGIAASLDTTAMGLTALLVAVPAFPAGRRGLRRARSAVRAGDLRWWHFCGGLGGALLVAGQGISVRELGVAVFTVAVVGGTAAGGIVADWRGLGPGGPRAVTPARFGGALLCVAAVAISGSGRLGAQGALGLVALPVLAGFAVAIQSGLNARVALAAGSPWPATVINFVVAWFALALAAAIEWAVRGFPGWRPDGVSWLYSAGFLGIAVIAVTTAVVRRVGVLVFGLAAVTGQLLGAAAIDLVVPGPRPTGSTMIGIGITIVAVLIAARPPGPRSG
ncbi:DMT family transporter [Amycolatopsis pigmentata]|uniref:DMT family transporter n=1 Tax=Amycolatopsis pigmentata TaxID=450801 RepID=A0ABW5FQB5_9PSEU